ncbi:bifunctional phosphoglucose/phosphomannose isomerase [Nanoarchaeota archaeon]
MTEFKEISELMGNKDEPEEPIKNEEFAFSVDEKDMLSYLNNKVNQINQAIDAASFVKIEAKFDKIIISGMGASAIAGDLMKLYVKTIPILINKSYTLPKFVDKNTLLISISYSGDTEETISCFRKGLRIGCPMLAITSGGKLLELCERTKTPFIKIPDNHTPRSAICHLFFSMLSALQNNKIISDKSEDIQKTIKVLKNDYTEKAKVLATKIANKIPIIYTSNKLQPVGLRWKEQFNENAKTMAFNNVFPELDHNEIVGYDNVIGDYFVIILKDEEDMGKIISRMNITKKIIKDKGVNITEIQLKGDNKLARMFTAIQIGDLTSYYLALLYGIDPTPTRSIDEIKKNTI